MEPKKLAHAISLIAWGYLFLYFNVTLGTIKTMPLYCMHVKPSKS